MLRTGAPVLVEDCELTSTHWHLGFTHGTAGQAAVPPNTFTARERAAYFRGHIRGTLTRRKADRSTSQ